MSQSRALQFGIKLHYMWKYISIASKQIQAIKEVGIFTSLIDFSGNAVNSLSLAIFKSRLDA